jgi:hypothetical protein
MKNDDIPACGNLRGTDSNSLLRLYDRARLAQVQSANQLDRARAARSARRIATVLRGRGVQV